MPTARPDMNAPLAGLTPLFASDAMRDADRVASARFAMPSILLMERAGLGTALAALVRYSDIGAATVLVGSGNNGGDGMVVARHLAEAGWAVRVILGADAAPATDDAALMTKIAASIGIEPAPFDRSAPPPHGVVVDALLGTGARGAPRGTVAEVIAWAADGDGPVVSCDVPSGVDADSGCVRGVAIEADLTTTYHGDMTGLHVAPGRLHAGEVEVVDIGIPSGVRSQVAAWLAGTAVTGAIPAKGESADKYAAGASLIIAGAEGLSGAACLAAEATLRAGGGLTAAVVPEAIQSTCARTVPEVMFSAAPGAHLDPQAMDEIMRQAARVGAAAIGPGLGREDATGELVWDVVEQMAVPLIIDADALFHVASTPDRLRRRAAATLLTPHGGEAARLLGVEREQVEANRLASAQRLADRTGAYVVLKGLGSIIASPQEEPVVNGVDAPALASAGTGDVLTGVLAALLAKGLEPRAAAVAGVALHGSAGKLLTGDGATAGDLLLALPRALEAR
ncbi:MAG: NAD(P)H-hydrate dehydratase [Thermoleophilia bacterium]|nr:NAD(P)H-hydrate dehydratase [Thermoleophilia bacterium]